MGLAGAAAVCVAGVALRDSGLHFAWHTWRLATWTFTLCGRPGTYGSGAGVALGDSDLHFAWRAWHLATATFTLRGRRGTYGTGVALVAWHLATWTFTLCGRRGTYGTGVALVAHLGLAGIVAVCVAGVVLGDSDLHFAWQAWRLVTSTFTWRGRPGTYGTRLALVAGLGLACVAAVCVAGVALGDSDLRTWRQRPSLCVASVALTTLGWLWWRAWVWRAPWLFAWQAWRLVPATFALRGRRGTWRTPVPSVCIHPPWSYISIKCMKGRGGQVVKPGNGKEVSRRFIHYYYF